MMSRPHLFSFIGLFASILGILIFSMLKLNLEPHIPLLFSTCILSLFCVFHGATWKSIEEGIIDGIFKGIAPILIMSLIGILIAAWMASGSVPYLIYWGLALINPAWFLPCALMLTILVSSFTGSSFTTVATVVAAMMGIGMSFGINPALIAGAVICGACFGDKMSPLSDTTNFASAVAGIDLYTHIRHMSYTTFPAIILSFLFFIVMGESNDSITLHQITALQTSIAEHFTLTPLTLLAPALVTFGAIRKYPIIPLLIAAIIISAILTLTLQPEGDLSSLLRAYQHGFQLETQNDFLAGMVNRGGLSSMLSSISLIMIALSLGGIAVKTGLLNMMLQGIISKVKTKGSIVASTALSSAAVNLFTGEMYLSILLPGQMFKPVYEKNNIALKNLSRTLEDAGTLVTPLIPWGVSGVFFAQTLSVSVLSYLPYVIFLYLCPLLTLLFGYIQKDRA